MTTYRIGLTMTAVYTVNARNEMYARQALSQEFNGITILSVEEDL